MQKQCCIFFVEKFFSIRKKTKKISEPNIFSKKFTTFA